MYCQKEKLYSQYKIEKKALNKWPKIFFETTKNKRKALKSNFPQEKVVDGGWEKKLPCPSKLILNPIGQNYFRKFKIWEFL